MQILQWQRDNSPISLPSSHHVSKISITLQCRVIIITNFDIINKARSDSIVDFLVALKGRAIIFNEQNLHEAVAMSGKVAIVLEKDTQLQIISTFWSDLEKTIIFKTAST